MAVCSVRAWIWLVADRRTSHCTVSGGVVYTEATARTAREALRLVVGCAGVAGRSWNGADGGRSMVGERGLAGGQRTVLSRPMPSAGFSVWRSVLPAISGTASRFLTRWELFWRRMRQENRGCLSLASGRESIKSLLLQLS